MSKELTPLEALENLTCIAQESDCERRQSNWSHTPNELKEIIETALKKQEQDQKKLKALEIIKKEISGCLEFYYDEEHDYGEVWCVQNEEESSVLIASVDSKEEYNLLKEMLK